MALVFLAPYVLFIGGRIIVFTLSSDTSVFDFFYFATYLPSIDEILGLVIHATIGFLSVFIGYLVVYLIYPRRAIEKSILKDFSPHQHIHTPSSEQKKILNIFSVLFLSASALLLTQQFKDLFSAVFSAGYTALYQSQTGLYEGSAFSVALTLLTISLCFGFATGHKIIRGAALFFFTVTNLALGLLGQRGALISLLIFYIALSVEKKNYLQKILYLGLGIITVAIALKLFSLFTLRDYSLEAKFGNPLVDFIYEQGATLSIFGISNSIPEYPLDAYIQSFIPGYASLMNIFGHPIPVDQINFGAFLSKTADEIRFNLGQGLGWSILGDAQQFLGAGYPMFLMLLGGLIGHVDLKRDSSMLFKGLWVLFVIKLSFLPRANIGSLIIPAIYYIIFYMTATFVTKQKLQH